MESPHVTFIVGRDKKTVVAHAKAVAATSKQLDELIKGAMSESAESRVMIEDLEPEDFIRFCEYAYCGDYTVPMDKRSAAREGDTSHPASNLFGGAPSGPSSRAISASPSMFAPSPGTSSNLSTPAPSPSTQLKTGTSSPFATNPNTGSSLSIPNPSALFGASLQTSTAGFGRVGASPNAKTTGFGMGSGLPTTSSAGNGGVFGAPAPQVIKIEPVEMVSKRQKFQNPKFMDADRHKELILQRFEPLFNPCLLTSARLYAFAHIRIIPGLVTLSLYKIHKSLTTMVGLFRTEDFMEVARFAYSHKDISNRKEDGTIDRLRLLVVQYIVSEIDTIGKNKSFLKMMEQGGEFVGDLWRMMHEDT